jgi:hypothetical protein
MGNRVRIAGRYNAPSSTHLNRNYSAAGTPAPVPTFFPLRERLRCRPKILLRRIPRPPSSSGAERVSGQTIQAGFVPLNPCAPIIVAHGSGSSPSTLSLSRLSANPASFAHRDSNWDESLLVSRGYTREAAIRPNKHHRTGNEDWRETAKSAGDNGVEDQYAISAL